MEKLNPLVFISALSFLIYSSATFAFELESDSIEQLSSFLDHHLITKTMIDHEREVLGQIAISKLNVNEIYANLKEKKDSNKSEFNYLQNYAILTAVYAEYLMEIDCKNLSKYYQDEAEKTYLKLNQLNKQDRYLRYNLAIFYARTSTFYRKNQNTDERYRLLQQAEKILLPLSLEYPKHKQYRDDYYAVISDQLEILQTKPNTLPEQKRIIDILQKPLFSYLKNPDKKYDSGNFTVLIQQYYKYLYAQNPKQADQWLISNQKGIEKFIQHNSSDDMQREYEFMAELYALLNQQDQALYYLKKIDPNDSDATEPKSLESERNFANLKLNPEFQAWLKHYTIQYQNNLDIHPKVCKSIQNANPIGVNSK